MPKTGIFFVFNYRTGSATVLGLVLRIILVIAKEYRCISKDSRCIVKDSRCVLNGS